MGMQQHRTLIAYTWDEDQILKGKVKLEELSRSLGFDGIPEYVAVLGVGANSGGSIVIGPEGSKEGWPQSEVAKDLRTLFWNWVSKQPHWNYAQIEFGELGNQAVYGK